MTQIRSEADFSDYVDSDLTWRLKELSDLKGAILDARKSGEVVLLKALIVLSYAHWEGYVKSAAEKYFEYITVRKLQFKTLNPQFYLNSFLHRVKSASLSNLGFKDQLKLISDIINSTDRRFSFVNDSLINTRSNLSFGVFEEICVICCLPIAQFEHRKTFVDMELVKRRHLVAHGQDALVGVDELDHLVSCVTELMRLFKNALENQIYTKGYLRQQEDAQ